MVSEKRKILFVDDEPNILNSLKRLLRTKNNIWDMSFAISGEEALRIINQQKIEIIVSDMRMPEMDGVELLKRIKEIDSSIIRIILSGYSDLDMILSVTETAHQYLAKPCDVELLEKIITQSCSLLDAEESENLIQPIAAITSVPVNQEVLSRLKNKLEQEEISIDEISEIVAEDLGISTKLLQLNYSAFFGFKRDIYSIYDAVNLLGTEILKALVLNINIFDPYTSSTVNRDSSNIKFGKYIEELISDIEDPSASGYIRIAGGLRETSSQMISGNPELEKLSEATKEKAGAYLLKLWGFPLSITDPIEYYRIPSEYTGEFLQGVAILHTADLLSKGENPLQSSAELLHKAGLQDKIDRISS